MLYIKAIIIILLSPTWNLSRTCPELILGISKIRFFLPKKRMWSPEDEKNYLSVRRRIKFEKNFYNFLRAQKVSF